MKLTALLAAVGLTFAAPAFADPSYHFAHTNRSLDLDSPGAFVADALVNDIIDEVDDHNLRDRDWDRALHRGLHGRHDGGNWSRKDLQHKFRHHHFSNRH